MSESEYPLEITKERNRLGYSIVKQLGKYKTSIDEIEMEVIHNVIIGVTSSGKHVVVVESYTKVDGVDGGEAFYAGSRIF